MNIDNVVMVRAMNYVPLNGELIPSCEGRRLVPDQKSDFCYLIRDIVRGNLEKQLERPLNLYFESPDSILIESMMKDYYVLTGDYYTTTLSFALNGLVPNDRNNRFDDMKMAVLEPIKNQMYANFVTIETIDTTIKGRIKTSDEAILVIEQAFFNGLPIEIQNNLKEHYQIKIFNSSLKEAIEGVLKEKGYPVLPLIQAKKSKNIEDCPEKESMLAFEDLFSTSVKASRLSLQQLTFSYHAGDEVDAIAHEKLAEEFDNTLIVENYYKKQLYEFMLQKCEMFGIEVNEEDRFYLFTEYGRSQEVMADIVGKLINAYGGLEQFKQFINDYNYYVANNYMTNEQIVSAEKANKTR